MGAMPTPFDGLSGFFGCKQREKLAIDLVAFGDRGHPFEERFVRV